jgi:hypothetical protein
MSAHVAIVRSRLENMPLEPAIYAEWLKCDGSFVFKA